MKRNEAYEKLWAEAHEAGIKAGNAVRPVPMVVVGGVPGEPPKAYYVDDGACGFAWVNVHPGNDPFARWAKENRGAHKAYPSGMQVKWVGEYGQSVDRKAAYAQAFADVLRAAGIKAVAGDRLD